MITRGSIAIRLSLTLGLCAAVFWLGAVGISGYVIKHELGESFNQTMRQSALRLLPLAMHEFEDLIYEGEYEGEEARFISGLTEQGSNLDYFVTNRSGKILIFTGSDFPNQSNISIAPGFSTLNGAPAFALRDEKSGFGILVVERAGLREEFLRESLKAMLLPLAALFPILVALAYFVVRAAMNPVWKLGRVIAKRHGRNLEPLDIGPQPRELAPIAREVENLLERLKSALQAERAFAAESAHELRTPIAGALAQVQVLRNALDKNPNQIFAIQAEEALQNLSALSENLLQLSRLEAGFAVSPMAEDLCPIIDLVLGEHEFASNKGRIILNGGPQALKAHIVPDAFAIVLRNLLRNAFLYGDGDDKITIAYGVNWLSVSNDCAALDPALLEKLTQRFVRGNETIHGSGLGLSITSGIIEDCGGTLICASPIAGQHRGFEAKFKLP